MRFVLLVTATAALALGCAKPQAPAQGAQPAEAPKSQMDLIAQDVLTPGGIYTQADIDANGNISPFEKYADVMNDPNMAHTPAGPGDYACPITGSKG
ncbi:MAG TPA: hypothetical protein VEI97_03650, partial [bacterium]|nr:hypothetical protein [bacterium]